MKYKLERQYGLPQGALNNDAYRAWQVPGRAGGFNFVDLMIEEWNLNKDINPNPYLEKTRSEVERLGSADLVFNDVRNYRELEFILDLQATHSVRVFRLMGRGDVKRSDALLPDLTRRFEEAGIMVQFFHNSGSIDELEDVVKAVSQDKCHPNLRNYSLNR